MNSKQELYDSYSEYKNWDGDTSFRPEDYQALLADAGLQGKLHLLEIGFGAGTFLDWAKAYGHQVQGLEILPEMVALVRTRGHLAYLVSESDQLSGGLDAVVAIDVLEHLSVDQLRDYFRLIRPLLKPEGVLVARFPNGDSPFLGRYHFGDLTHERPLTSSALNQIAATEGYQVTRTFNPRSMPPGLLRRLKRACTYMVRDFIEITLGYAYFGFRFPMDPNVAVVLALRGA